MKKRISILLAFVMLLTTIFSVDTFAASWPGLSTSKYCEFKAAKTINVYKNTSCTTRGTSSPSKSYNASISKNDICYIYQISSSYIQVNYPTSSGRRTGYIKRGDLISNSSPSSAVTSGGKATVYVTPGGASYGSTAKGDTVYHCGSSNGYTAVIYTAKSGNRAYKFGWVKTSDYNSIIQKSTQSSVSNTLRFPLKGSIVRSSSVKTNGYYCDYKTGGSVPVYAPANGTVVFKQNYNPSTGKLCSYGNYIEFTSSDGVYKVKCCHLSKFQGVSLKVTKSLSYPCSASQYKTSTYVLATRTVKQGELLGYTGYTGNASGHHLHLEVRKNNTPVNPTSVFKTW